MILSVDLSPALKKEYIVDKELESGHEYMSSDNIIRPTGNGVELGILLNELNEKVFMSGILGGINGEFIHRNLLDMSIPHEFYPIKEETQDCVILNSQDQRITVLSKETRVSRDEMRGFTDLYNRLIHDFDYICIQGKSPQNISGEIFYDLIAAANAIGKKTLISCEAEDLKYALEAGPYAVVINRSQLEELTNLKLEFEYEIIKAALYIKEKGVKFIVITLGIRGCILLTEDYIYRIDIEGAEISDGIINDGYILGGLAMGWKRDYDTQMSIKLGVSCGYVNMFEDKDHMDMSIIKKIMGFLNVSRFNY